MNKKSLLIFAALTAALSLSACGGGGGEDTKKATCETSTTGKGSGSTTTVIECYEGGPREKESAPPLTPPSAGLKPGTTPPPAVIPPNPTPPYPQAPGAPVTPPPEVIPAPAPQSPDPVVQYNDPASVSAYDCEYEIAHFMRARGDIMWDREVTDFVDGSQYTRLFVFNHYGYHRTYSWDTTRQGSCRVRDAQFEPQPGYGRIMP